MCKPSGHNIKTRPDLLAQRYEQVQDELWTCNEPMERLALYDELYSIQKIMKYREEHHADRT